MKNNVGIRLILRLKMLCIGCSSQSSSHNTLLAQKFLAAAGKSTLAVHAKLAKFQHSRHLYNNYKKTRNLRLNLIFLQLSRNFGDNLV